MRRVRRSGDLSIREGYPREIDETPARMSNGGADRHVQRDAGRSIMTVHLIDRGLC